MDLNENAGMVLISIPVNEYHSAGFILVEQESLPV